MEIQGIKYEVKVSVCKDIGQTENQDVKGNDGAVLVYSVVDKKSLTYLKTVAFQKLHDSLGASDKTAAKDTNGTDVNQSPQQQSAGADGSGKEIAETPTGQPDEVGLSVPVILVGNKVDDAKLSRAVESEDGEALSKELCCVGFYETAATCNANVPKAFERLLNEIVTQRLSVEDSTDKPVKPTNACCVVM
uniref:Ras-related protein Rab-10-like n=1 Tax=Phallusia mammillata TaxID=59560 RepID=A0A6F9DQN8_9ASCI|nr:ras-related protein Rab-10-like [Phallusia mammillata]